MHFPVLIEKSAAFDANSAADKATFSFPHPARIVEVGVIVRGADNGGATIAFDRRITAGSDTGRVADYAGVITIAAANLQGKVLVEKKSDVNILVDAGDEIVVDVTAEAVTALSCVAYIKYVHLPENILNEADVTAA